MRRRTHLISPTAAPSSRTKAKARLLVGQRALQAASDVMLGWTEMDKRHYYVRQMKNLKASVPIEWMTGEGFEFHCWACGTILARAHARIS